MVTAHRLRLTVTTRETPLLQAGPAGEGGGDSAPSDTTCLVSHVPVTARVRGYCLHFPGLPFRLQEPSDLVTQLAGSGPGDLISFMFSGLLTLCGAHQTHQAARDGPVSRRGVSFLEGQASAPGQVLRVCPPSPAEGRPLPCTVF